MNPEISPTNRPVLVAVDGSPESLGALDWAVEYASARHLDILVVTAVSSNGLLSSDSSGSYQDVFDEALVSAKRRVVRAIRSHTGRTADCYHVVVFGSIDYALHAQSSDAHLVVIGTRRQNRLQRWMRPSATDRLTGTLTCPVVSVTRSSQPNPPTRPGLKDPAKELTLT